MTLDVVAYGETTFTVRGTAADPDAPGVAGTVAFIGHDAASSSWIELYDGMTNTDGEIVHSFAYVNLEGYDLLRLDAVHGGTVYFQAIRFRSTNPAHRASFLSDSMRPKRNSSPWCSCSTGSTMACTRQSGLRP